MNFLKQKQKNSANTKAVLISHDSGFSTLPLNYIYLCLTVDSLAMTLLIAP